MPYLDLSAAAYSVVIMATSVPPRLEHWVCLLFEYQPNQHTSLRLLLLHTVTQHVVMSVSPERESEWRVLTFRGGV